MRRRFGRGRRTGRGTDGGRSAIDAERWLTRLREDEIVAASELAPLEGDEVPDTFAAVGRGKTEGDAPLLVGFAPQNGGDAALAVLAVARRLMEEESFSGQAIAVAPQWDASARGLLGMIGEPAAGLQFRAIPASALDEGDGAVAPSLPGAFPVPPERVADGLGSAESRELFLRALAAFEGLAAKHGGVVRGTSDSAELVLVAQRVAVLKADGERVVLETTAPDKSTATLESGGLAAALDRLEGQLRKRLNDRRVRSSEEGVRSRALQGVAEAAGLRAVVAWPAPARDGEVLDLAGLDAEGRPVLAAIRSSFGLAELSAVLEAALAIRPALPVLFAGASGPLRLSAPRLALVSSEFSASAVHALAALTLDHALYDLRERRGGDPEVVLRGEGTGAPASSRARAERPERSEPRRSSRSRSRGGRGRSGGQAAAATSESAPAGGDASSAKEAKDEGPRFDDVSLFDLDEEPRAAEDKDEDGQRPRRRRRGRRRGRRQNGGEDAQSPAEAAPAEEGDSPAAEELSPGVEEDDDALVDVDDPAEALAPIAELAEEEAETPSYDDDDELAEPEEEDWTQERERELRRRTEAARAAAEPVVEEAPKRPRRRSAIVVHADRDSIAAGVVLARDIRMLEGFWVYPQEDLMTFFRGVATDLKPDTPIFIVGFTARPARDAIQAASLYAGRLTWFDHHEWPPEDLGSLRSALGEANVVIEPGSGSSLPAVLADRSRRSRFSDKLVELFTGRFTQHDYERWGQLWWYRLGEVAKTTGERRHSVDPLLAGRPSDLARDASRSGPAPVPAEVTFVSERDFRVVHFGGFTLVVVAVPEGLDLHLVARAARERFGAQMSLAHPEGGELLLLGADESRGRGGWTCRPW